jgi:UDP-3-O-[3-hydroxymyristoyl] glucosamine N-acyltransferase
MKYILEENKIIKIDESQFYSQKAFMNPSFTPTTYAFVENDYKNVDGKKLRRIIATENFATAQGMKVKKGEKGGYIENVNNCRSGCWVGKNAVVYGLAMIAERSYVEGTKIYGVTKIYKSHIDGNYEIFGRTEIWNSEIFGEGSIQGCKFDKVILKGLNHLKSENLKDYDKERDDKLKDLNKKYGSLFDDPELVKKMRSDLNK